MSDDHDTLRERLVRLETKIEVQDSRLQKIERDTAILVEIMQQAKGAKWILLIAASIGGFIATKAASVIGILPR